MRPSEYRLCVRMTFQELRSRVREYHRAFPQACAFTGEMIAPPQRPYGVAGYELAIRLEPGVPRILRVKDCQRVTGKSVECAAAHKTAMQPVIGYAGKLFGAGAVSVAQSEPQTGEPR